MHDSKKGGLGASIDIAFRRFTLQAWLLVLPLLVGCGSGVTDGNPGSGLGGQGAASGGGASNGGAGSNSGVGGFVLALGGSSGTVGQSGGAGSAGLMSSCPDLGTPPVDCPAKVYPDNVVIRSQATADALAGYTEIDGSLLIIQDCASDLRQVDALRCLQKIRFELSAANLNTSISLDGLKELSEIGGWLEVARTKDLTLGCGLRKLSKLGTHSATPYVEFEGNE